MKLDDCHWCAHPKHAWPCSRKIITGTSKHPIEINCPCVENENRGNK